MANPLDVFDPEQRDPSSDPVIPSGRQAVVNRFKAADMAERGIPSYQNEHGDVTELRDPQGQPLSGLDANNNIAYDTQGQPQQIVQNRTGPPTVRDAFANIPPVTDPKTGAIEKYGPGGIYQYEGQDPTITAAALQKDKDKATTKEAALVGRKLKMDEHDLITGTKEHNALKKSLQEDVPTLLDKKYKDASPETIQKGIEEHFNAEYATPEANATSGFFSKNLSPDAQALRASIDERKTRAIETAGNLFAVKDRLNELSATVKVGKGQQRDAVETLLAHQRGETGPLDERAQVAASKEAVPQLYPPEKDWSRMLGGATAADTAKPATEDQTAPNVPTVTGRVDTDQAIKDAKAGNKTYGVGEDDQVHFKPETLYSGLYHATRDGLIDPKWADEHRAEFKKAQDKYNELVDAAGSADVLKAVVHGAGIGGAFLAGAAPGAKLGGLALSETGPVGATIGAALGGLATGTIAAFYAKKGIDKLAEYSDAVKSLTASAELNPIASAGGELLAFGASAPRALSKLLKLSTLAGEAVSDLGPTAMRTAQLKVVGRQLGIGALTGAAFEGVIRPTFDVARYAAADALGIKHDAFQSPDAKSLLTMAALGALTAGHSIEFKDYSAGDVASILMRAKIRRDAGIDLGAEATAQVVKAASDAGIKFDSNQSAAISKPLSPQEINVWNGLREKTERMQRSGAFDDATGVKFTGAKQATVKSALGKEGAPIVSAGVEAVKGEGGDGKGPKTPELPGKPPEKPANGRVIPPEPASSEADATKSGANGSKSVDEAAHQAATSPKNDLTPPTPDQQKAGNYAKGHQKIGPEGAQLDVSIENPAGSKRRPEWPTLQSHYGYIKGTKGADLDHNGKPDKVDVFIKEGTPTDYSGPVFVINQYNKDGKFDEHKAIIGVDTPEAAKAEYLKNYEKGWTGGKSVVEQPSMKAFKDWVTSGRKSVPATTSKLVGPVLVDAAGNVIAKGKIGQTHEDLSNAIIKNEKSTSAEVDAAIEAGTNDSLHKFVDKKGNVVDRTQGARIAVANDQAPKGTTKLQSQDLIKHAAAKEAAAAAQDHKITQLVTGAMGAHRETLKNLGHGDKPTIGKMTPGNETGIEARNVDGKPTIVMDPKQLHEATKHLSERAQVKFIQRTTEEEILHVAALKWENQSAENAGQLKAWGGEKDELAEHLSSAYEGWNDLDDRQKAHEKLRAVLQKRWTGKLTEAAYRALKSFLKYLRGIYEKLSPGQRKIVDDVEAMMKRRETSPKTEPSPESKPVSNRETSPKASNEAVKKEETNATTTGEQQSSQEGQFSRVPPRTDLPENPPEIRTGNGEQAAGGGGVVQRPSPPVKKPEVRQPATASKLNPETQKQLKEAFKGLFAATPELTPLSEMEKTALTALQKARDAGTLGTAGEKQLRKLEERSQGELFGQDQGGFALTGETAIDGEALQKQLDQQDETRRAQEGAQGSLFAARPTNQRGIPSDKLIPFMQLAQKMVEEGVDTPEKLAHEILAIDERAIPYSQALWDAIGQVKPELRGTHDWSKIYPKPEKVRKFRASAPDGGFSEHPFIATIINDLGGILSKTAARKQRGDEWFEANKSLWDGAPQLADPRHSKVYDPKSGQTPDAIASALEEAGLLRDGDVEEMWRQLGQISESSKRIERQEREQARLEKDYVEPEIEDPFDDSLAISGEKSQNEGDDTGSSLDLEGDSGNADLIDQGSADSLPAGPGAAGDNEPVSNDIAGGSSDPAASGPLSSDVPSAPHREPSDLLFPEPTPGPAQRPPGSVEPEGGSQPGDRGVPSDVSRTRFPGESLNLPSDAQDVGSVGQSGGTDLDAVQRAAPALTPEQADDVRFIESRLQEQGKPGVLLTNGTGTGKTFSGLGAIKMMLDRGAQHILVAAPSDKIGSDWVHTAKTFFGIPDVMQLPSTSESGADHRVVVTTYANFGQNDTLVKRPWDMIVTDEAHYLSSSETGEDTLALDALRALTFHPDGNLRRVKMLEPDATVGLQRIRAIERHNKGVLTAEQKAKRAEYQGAIDARMKEVRAAQSALKISERPKVLMLSATPFAYRKNVAYAEGYLFDYPAVEDRGYNTPSPFGQFMIENFGYRMRTGRLTEPENATATGILERRFAERLMREKAMRGRALVVPFDYSRDFVLSETQLGKKIDEIITKMMSSERLRHLDKYIGVTDYLQRRFILESLKAREAIDRIRKHIALGRKVVVFHDYKLGGAMNPLAPSFDATGGVHDSKHGYLAFENLFDELQSHFPDWEETSRALQGLRSPIQYFMQAFGPGELGVFNGSVPKKQRRAIVAAFNQRGGQMKVMLAQRASAKEGISLHDTDGDEQRVFLDLGIPGRPTDAIQSEGRIYRHGVKSNAVDEYLVTGTNFERWTFAQTIAQRASTAENLAMGDGARALLQSFSTGFNEASAFEPHAEQGVGGKEADAVRERGDPYKNAVALYYTNEKKTSRSKSREGVDYYATPEPIGFKMVEWAMLQPGEKFLEPSAGHGAIARFAPDSTTRHAVEPSNELAGRLALNAPDTEIHNEKFEDFNVVNKFDGIAMNPPYGHSGKTAMEHLEKAVKHLRVGGRVVALIPMGSSMEKRFDQWYALHDEPVYLRASITLPSVAFERAGTAVSARIVVLDRFETKGDANVHQDTYRDLSGITDIKELFDRLEHLSVPARPEKKVVEPAPDSVEIDGKPPAPPPSGGYTPDPGAERKPLSPDQLGGHWEDNPDGPGQVWVNDIAKPTRDSSFTPADFLHTKSREPVFVAKTARYMSKLEFHNARARAKQLGGYYSSFKGAGAIPGFHFKTVEARDAFISTSEERGLGAARPIRAVAAVYKEDVERVAKEIGLTAKESFILLRKLVSPTTGVAMQAHDQVMKMLATRNQKAYETDRVLESARKMFDDLARDDQVDFIDRMKRGEPQVTPELQQVADTMRKIDTESWQAAVNAYAALGFKASDIPLSWLDNHYRVLWKKIPGQTAAQQSAWIGRARRGLRGSMGQHKQHTLDDMSEGLDMGGIPYSYNPVVMFKLAQADLWKLTSTLRTWKWGKDNDFVKFERGAHPKAPDGMVPLDDSIAKIYFPASSGEGLVAAGQYFVEEGFGRLLNNYLSKDVIRQVKLGRGLLWIKNFTTAIELSLSAFHGVFETMEAIGSNIGLGLNKLTNRGLLKGDMSVAAEGLKDIIGSLTVLPVQLSADIARGFGIPIPGSSLGAEIRKAAADPVAYFQTAAGQDMLKKFPRAREMVDDLFAGGWKPNELEQDWKNNSVRTFIDSVSDIKAGSSDNYVGAAVRAIPAFNELLMKPLFDHYIPNLKVAQFFKEYAEALEQNAGKLASGVITRPALARQVWRFVEDRFGEMNFDSLFWNSNFKTAMQLLFRSVTWKLGSVEAFAGAFAGQGKEFRDAFKERRAPELHRNTAWLFGMFALTATLGYIISKTMAGKDPKDLKDYVFPQIDPKDDKIRVSLPTYFKDAVHLWHSPLNYVTASMSGWIGRVMDLLRNKDYFGVQIRDTDDSVTKQALQVGKYVGETMLPFSVRGYKNLSAQDVSSLRKFLAVVGVNPAPRYIGQSAAERKSEEYWKGTQTVAGVKPEQFESKMAKRKLVAQLQHGESPDISDALATGALKPKDIKPLYQRAQMGALASQVLHMPLEEAERVYSLATQKEKLELAAIMIKKRANAAKAGRKLFQGF